MSDPKRLRDCAAPGTVERALLDSARQPIPTNDQCDALWVALAARVPESAGQSSDGGSADGPASTTANASAAKAAVAGAMGKLAGLVIGIAGIAGAMAALVPSRASRPTGHTEASVVPPRAVGSLERLAEPIAGAPGEAPVALAPPPPSEARHSPAKGDIGVAGARVGKPTSTTAASPLREEAELLLGARGVLRSGDCTGALEKLEGTRARFPDGALSQEREALAIEALVCAGRDVEAADRAAAFLREYPASPHANAVGRLARESMTGN
jgi:hypothetical protein